MPHPFFSVIIPTFNREALVGATLDSVFAQDFTDFEVLVVDDGSTDGTLDVVRGYGDHISVIEQDHKGCAAARNLGAKHAAGKYIAFLDSDDLWFPWTLEVFAEAIHRHKDPAFVGGRLAVFHDPGELQGMTKGDLLVRSGADFFSSAQREGFGLGVAHGVVSREVYLQVGGCEEVNVNGTDSDVLLKLGTAPGFALLKQPATLGYRKHGGATTKNHDKSLAGVRLLLNHERDGVYLGGPSRRQERIGNILARTRGVSREALSEHRPDVAWWIYRETFGWNLRHLRGRYLLAMPLLIGVSVAGRLLSSKAE